MRRLCFLVLFFFVISSLTARNYGFNTSYNESGIILEVLSVASSNYISVNYPGMSPNGVLIPGDFLTPTQVKEQPLMTWNYARDQFYTVVMIDLDGPSHAMSENGEWLHWLVVNVPGDDIDAGDTIAEYIGAGPPKDTGLHRYVLLVYQQPYKMTFNEPRLTSRSMANRTPFSVRKFTTKYNLGDLIAGNFFQAEYDDYVPILYRQLGASGGKRSTLNSKVIALTGVVMVLTLLK